MASVAELLDAFDDPFLRYDVGPSSTTALPAWANGSAAAYLRRPPHRRRLSMNLHGPGPDAAPLIDVLPELIEAAAAAHPDLAGLSVEAHLLDAVHERLGAAYRLELMGQWSWLSTRTLVATESHCAVVELDDSKDAPELLAFYDAANPDAESEPGEGTARYWLGVRRGDALVAAGALHLTPAGAPHLTGIAVHPAHRRTGLGAAVTIGLTRHALEQHAVATLGVMTDNQAALGLYRRLGYVVAHDWCSHTLTR